MGLTVPQDEPLLKVENLQTHFGTLDGVMAATSDQLAAVDGVGPKIAESITAWFAQEPNREFIEKLRAAAP